MNSQKAIMFLRLSSVWEQVELHEISYPEDNQSLEFARMNPNMTVPTLEIDDKIITDSHDIQRYLYEKYPCQGDIETKDREGELQEFIDTVYLKWDEYLYSYRRIPPTIGRLMHDIRLVKQSEAVMKAVKAEQLEEKLRDGRTIREVYTRKIAQTRALISVGTDAETPELRRRIEENDARLEKVFEATVALLGKSSGPFLMGTHIGSGEAFMLALMNRIEFLDMPRMERTCEKYPVIRDWWVALKASDEAQAVLGKSRVWMLASMILSKPWKFIGLKTGLWVPYPLPEDLEEAVQQEQKRIEDGYLAD